MNFIINLMHPFFVGKNKTLFVSISYLFGMVINSNFFLMPFNLFHLLSATGQKFWFYSNYIIDGPLVSCRPVIPNHFSEDVSAPKPFFKCPTIKTMEKYPGTKHWLPTNLLSLHNINFPFLYSFKICFPINKCFIHSS